MSSITLTDVTKSYGNVQVIQSFTETFADGEFVTLLGPSGCGKTTMLRMIAGFEKPTTGEIKIDDTVVSGGDRFVPPNERGIGMVFQSYAVWPHMDVFDNVVYPLKIQGVKRSERKKRVLEVLEAVHLSQYVKRMPSELSGGQQQRVAIARALSANPEIIYFDEPTSALDPELIGEVLSVMKQLAEDGMTMLVVTHELSFAENVSNRVIFMENGNIVEQGPSKEFFANPREQRTREFLKNIRTQHDA